MRKIAFFVLLAALVASCVFPPWQNVHSARTGNIKLVEVADYAPIWECPKNATGVDYGRLGVQVGVIALLMTLLVATSRITLFPTSPKTERPIPSAARKKSNWKTVVVVLVMILLVGYVVAVTARAIDLFNDRTSVSEEYDRLYTEHMQICNKYNKLVQDYKDLEGRHNRFVKLSKLINPAPEPNMPSSADSPL